MQQLNAAIATARLNRLATERWRGAFSEGAGDLASGLSYWRLCHLIGLNEIRRRYSRSRIGQFWLTLSTAIMVVALGTVWSTLWNAPLHNLMPFIAISIIVWNLISATLGEATTTFVTAGPMFLNQGMCFSIAVYGLLYKNALVFLHNIPIILVTMMVFRVPVGWRSLLSIVGLACVFMTLLWLSYIIAIACLRFRDLAQLVQSILMIAFFVTPVMWKPEQLGPKEYLLSFNPFANLLAVVRDPLLGRIPGTAEWTGAIAVALFGFLVALPFIGICRRRIIYWM